MYLLPAGDSTFLGTVKSMVLEPFPVEENLSKRLLRRPVPLFGQKVLVVTGRGKNKEDAKVFHLIYLADESAIIISFCMRWVQNTFTNVPCWRMWMRISRREDLI